ncbi:winged helix-turn-helix domain-containing protein [Stenotrophomonas nitritireducens]|uniref:winged helix-turn-helix domain-containing protein n=1 Tax=Stenotrophomonas nitritireducens TaxID=83617 RepID=UPI0007705E3D|nr:MULTISPECIES: winged helix-turn-helix domain-containing protein [Stenotrophomonas]AMJ56161.1 transcriptional regulator [Stenotrophomonas sp. KCTC 12332]
MALNLTEKSSSDRLRVGECLVVLSSREVHLPGTRKTPRLTPKSVGVLLALARRPGQVVTREELFADVWPDTMPTNDVLTQAVTQLRKAFAFTEAGEGTSYIETIAKTGYRLLAPVAWESSPELAAVDAPAAAGLAAVHASVTPEQDATRGRHRRLRRHVLMLIGIVLLLSTVVMGWLLWGRAAPVPQDATVADGNRVLGSPARPYRLITATEDAEVNPSLSPDGALVVFARERDNSSSLWIQSVGNATATPLLVTPAGATDRFPVWSPDGRSIAFARFLPQGDCEVLVVSATGTGLRRVTRCDGTDMLSFDWAPDGGSLLFGSMTGRYASRGIRSLNLASGRWSSLQYTMGADDFDYAPSYSADGRKIGFVRNPQVGDMWMMDADGSNAQRLTNDAAEIRGWSWLGSDEMVFGRRIDSESRLYRLDVATRMLRDMGIDNAQSPSVSRGGGNLVFMRSQFQSGLFRIPLGASRAPPQRLFASSARDGQPIVSPDGTQLAFTSDRSGAFALWWARLNEPASLQLIEGMRPEARQPMDWAADGRHLLVTGRDADGAPGIYEVAPEEGHWVKLAVPVREPLQAVYGAAADNLLVVERGDDERMALTLFDRSQQPWKRLASLEGVSQVRYDRAGQRILFTRLANGGLWQVAPDLAAGSIKPVHAELPSRWRYRTWAVAANGAVEYQDISRDCSSRLTAIAGDGTSQCLDPTRFSAGNGLSLAPDGSAVFIALGLTDSTDIGIMRVPHRAPRRVMGLAKWLSP